MPRSAVIILALVAILSIGCASAGPRKDRLMTTERLAYLAIGADLVTTVVGVTSGGFKEGGIGRWAGDDAALVTTLAINVLLVYALRRSHRRYPDWRGWKSADIGIAFLRTTAAVNNARLILE